VSRRYRFGVTTWNEADASSRPAPEPATAHAHAVHVVDRRGLTAVGAVTVALVLGAAGGFVDVMTGPGLRTVFAVCFIAGCAFAALRVHREDLIAAVVMPPLVYAALALLAGAFSRTAAVGGLLTRQALELATSLVLGAPVLLTATGVAFAIAVVRGLAGRRQSAPAND
jgi:cation transporter-like permease